MGKLKLEARHRVEQNQVQGHEIIEYAEQKQEEARQINSPSHLPFFDLDEDEDFNYIKDSRLEANGVCERSRKLDEKLRKFRLYQNIRDAIGGRYYRK